MNCTFRLFSWIPYEEVPFEIPDLPKRRQRRKGHPSKSLDERVLLTHFGHPGLKYTRLTWPNSAVDEARRRLWREGARSLSMGGAGKDRS